MNTALTYDLTHLRRVTVNLPRPATKHEGLFESYKQALLAIFQQRYGVDPAKVSFRNAPEFDVFAFTTESKPDDIGKVLLFRCAFNQHRVFENSIWDELLAA